MAGEVSGRHEHAISCKHAILEGCMILAGGRPGPDADSGGSCDYCGPVLEPVHGQPGGRPRFPHRPVAGRRRLQVPASLNSFCRETAPLIEIARSFATYPNERVALELSAVSSSPLKAGHVTSGQASQLLKVRLPFLVGFQLLRAAACSGQLWPSTWHAVVDYKPGHCLGGVLIAPQISTMYRIWTLRILPAAGCLVA